jgi:putative transposase
MSSTNRCIQPGLAYHVTQRGSNKQAIFFETFDHRTYLRLLRDNQQDCGVKILAYCLMPNHVHLIVRPEFEDSLGVFFRRVHGSFARYINLKEGRSGHLWTNRYFCCSLSATHLRRALHYVEHNPVRAGLAARPEDFPWSSAAAHIGRSDNANVLDLEFWQSEGGASAWREMLATPQEILEGRILRACTFARRPFGDDDFVKAESERLGRGWYRKPLLRAAAAT